MEKTNKQRFWTTKTLVLTGVMTALVIVFQGLASFFPNIFGPFAGAIALIPIVIGAALCGPWIGTWLGFVFAMVVLLTGNAAFFMQYDGFATILIVVLKGTLCGMAAGFTYKLLSKVNDIFAAIVASLICPIVNTGIFLLGGMTMLTDNLQQLTGGESEGYKAALAFFWGLAMANFIFEILMCAVLSPIVVKLLNIRKKMINIQRK